MIHRSKMLREHKTKPVKLQAYKSIKLGSINHLIFFDPNESNNRSTEKATRRHCPKDNIRL